MPPLVAARAYLLRAHARLVRVQGCLLRVHVRVIKALSLTTKPWRHWLIVYAVLLVYFCVFRCVALSSMLHSFAAPDERTTGTKTSVLLLGLWEDITLVSLLLVVLAACDYALGPRRTPRPPPPVEEESEVTTDKPTTTAAAAAATGATAVAAPAIAASSGGVMLPEHSIVSSRSRDFSHHSRSHSHANEDAPASSSRRRQLRRPPSSRHSMFEEIFEVEDEPIIPIYVRQAVLLYTRRVLRLAAHSALVIFAMVPFAVDTVLVRTRGMRFSFDMVNLFIREHEYVSGIHVSHQEVHVSTQTSVITLVVACLLVTFVMVFLDLSQWHPAKLFGSSKSGQSRNSRDSRDPTPTTACSVQRDTSLASAIELVDMHKSDFSEVDFYTRMEDGHGPSRDSPSRNSPSSTTGSPATHPVVGETAVPPQVPTHGNYIAEDSSDNQSDQKDVATLATTQETKALQKAKYFHIAYVIWVPFMVLFMLCTSLLVATHAVPAVVSASALNGSLNELFRVIFHLEFLHTLGDGTIESAGLYLDANSESYELFQDDVLYRKTTGFKGKLAFDVKVDQKDPPNVVILTIESFRYQDSQQIVGNKSAALTEKTHNITLTPQFDKWAQKGITFRNFWSSWQTSRSVESILFGQVPYDHTLESGMTTGRHSVKLNGMPQLFHKKGYETLFTSGVRLKYDQWDRFMETHGFDFVMGSTIFKAYAEQDYGILPNDWKTVEDGGQGRAGFWGVHDDVTLDVLADLMVNKTLAQQARQRRNEAKNPFFLTHYTISSHSPFTEYPKWFENEEKPDFSQIYQGSDAETRKNVEKYAKLRYFTDLALGKFLTRLQDQGVLNDTIIVIVGDHGQSPESGLEKPDVDEISSTRVAAALIAEGRLGKYAGLILDEAAEQYDLLNTIADIVGVPEGGFLQSGVGKSLKRASDKGEEERAVYSNNPLQQMAVIMGHQRLSYDRVFSKMGLFETENDPNEENDLWPETSGEQRKQWEKAREDGRRLSRYFRLRWDHKCISKVKC